MPRINFWRGSPSAREDNVSEEAKKHSLQHIVGIQQIFFEGLNECHSLMSDTVCRNEVMKLKREFRTGNSLLFVFLSN